MIVHRKPTAASNTDAVAILGVLSQMQFVRPHQSLQSALQALQNQIGICRVVIDRAVEWLELDDSQALGRLRRGELAQLAECLHRFWRRVESAPVRSAQ